MDEIPLIGGPTTFALAARTREPLPQGTFPEVLDSTMLSTYTDCPAKFHMQYCLNRAPAKASVHLHAGAAFARGIEVTRKAFYESGLHEEQALAEGLVALWQSYGEDGPFANEAKSGMRMAEALVRYFTTYPLSKEKLVPARLGSSYAVEFSFGIPLESLRHPTTGNPLILAGRFDMIGEFQGGLFCVDEKTTKAIGPTWSRQWDLRSQFLCYNWAAQSYGHPTIGTIVRGVGISKTKLEFAEAIIYYAPWEVERWYWQAVAKIKRMLEDWEHNKWEYNLGTSCTSYGGCTFQRTCKSPYPSKELGANFVEKIWDPLGRS